MIELINIGNWLSHTIDFPAIVLLLILLMGWWVMYKTQQNPTNNFRFEDMLRDDQGKPSASRLAVFVCLAVSTWAVMYMAIATSGKLDVWIFTCYVAIWSGARVAERAIEVYGNTRGIQFPQQPTDVPPISAQP